MRIFLRTAIMNRHSVALFFVLERIYDAVAFDVFGQNDEKDAAYAPPEA